MYQRVARASRLFRSQGRGGREASRPREGERERARSFSSVSRWITHTLHISTSLASLERSMPISQYKETHDKVVRARIQRACWVHLLSFFLLCEEHVNINTNKCHKVAVRTTSCICNHCLIVGSEKTVVVSRGCRDQSLRRGISQGQILTSEMPKQIYADTASRV